MFGIISSGSNAIALLQTRLAMARNKTATSAATKPETAKTEAEKAAAEKVRRAQDALDAMKQANAARKQQRKAAAREKIDRLKKELEVLRMTSGLGDPKAIARRAKQIARELGAAAKEYAAAGGGGGGTTPSEPVSAGGDGTVAQADAAAATAQAQVGGGGQNGSAQDGGGAGGKDAQQQNAVAEAKDAELKDAGVKSDQPTSVGTKAAQAEAKAEELVAKAEHHDEKHQAKPVVRTPEQERLATVQAFQKAAGDMLAKSTQDVADSKFAADVRNLYQQVKALMEQQRRRAKQQGTDDQEMERLSKQVADMGADIETSLSGGDVAEVMMPVNLQV